MKVKAIIEEYLISYKCEYLCANCEFENITAKGKEVPCECEDCIHSRVKEIYIDKEYSHVEFWQEDFGYDYCLKLGNKLYIYNYYLETTECGMSKYSIKYLEIEGKKIIEDYSILELEEKIKKEE